MKKRTLKIMIVAGELSGDAHAAKLVNELRNAAADTDLSFFGAAGKKMRAAAVDAVVNADDLAIVGLLEIAVALPKFIGAKRKLVHAAKTKKPDVAILVDFPDFNLKLAKSLKRLGIKVVYYISPQLWAWRQYRIKTIKKYVDLLLVILPFEKNWYARRNVSHVEYVGNPLAREVEPTMTKVQFRRDTGINAETSLVALLPGSRTKEIVRILPEMLGAARRVLDADPNTKFFVAAADEKGANIANDLLTDEIREGRIHEGEVSVVVQRTYDLLNAADAAVITSGTATLEAGILGVPMVIVYKTSRINYGLFEPIISVPHYGLVNLIAEKRVATELIQDKCDAETIAAEVIRLLEPETNATIRAELAQATDRLGHGGASKRAAEAILKLVC